MMEWYNFFKSIILERGVEYYQSGCVTITNFDGNCMNADKMIEECSGTNESPKIYLVHHGYEDVLLKRLEYMKMLDCSDSEIMEYRKQNRHFYVIREILLFYLENFRQNDLHYFTALKKDVKNDVEWKSVVDRIVASNEDLYFVCDVLKKEDRCGELMDKIEENDNIHVLDEHVNYLKKALPYRVIDTYAGYVLELAKTSADRNRYRELAKYLKKISDCPNGKKTAVRIADGWHLEYKRRPAMMDELRKMGF